MDHEDGVTARALTVHRRRRDSPVDPAGRQNLKQTATPPSEVQWTRRASCTQYSVTARHISEGAAPCPYCLAPGPQNCAQTLFRSRAGLRPNFGRSRVKVLVTHALNCDRLCFVCALNCDHDFTDRPVHKIVPRSCFVCLVLDCAWILGVRALNCARISVVRALDCAQFLLHPALFPT